MSKLRFREVKNNLLEVTLLVSEQVIDLISLPSPVCLQDTLLHLDVHVLNGCSFSFFLFGCAGSSLLRGLVSSCGAQAFLVAEHRLQDTPASVVVAQGLNSCGFWTR